MLPSGVTDRFHEYVQKYLDTCRVNDATREYGLLNEEFEQCSSFFCFDPFYFSFEGSVMEMFFSDIRYDSQS